MLVPVVIGGVLIVIGLVVGTRAFLPAYLASFLFAGLIPVGALGPLLLLDACGSASPATVPLRALGRLVPLASLLFVPVLIGLGGLYPWVHGAPPDTPLAHAWLGTPFFVVRSIIYLLLWSGLSVLFAWRDPGAVRRRPTALLALFAHFVLFALASIDWMMSLDPHWHQTELGLVLALATAAAALAAASLVGVRTSIPARVNDLVVLLAAASLLWFLSQFFLFLTTWSADQPDEVKWYLARDSGIGRASEWFAAIAGAALPVALSLGAVALRVRALGTVAVLVLLAHAVEFWWFVLPAHADTLAPGLTAILVLAGWAFLLGAALRCADRPDGALGGRAIAHG